jgi:integrase
MNTPISKYIEHSISNPWGFSLKGIRPEGKCPNCHGTFKRDLKKGYRCPTCRTHPERFSIDVWFKGERIRRATTLDGKTLRSFADAHSLFKQAVREKEEKTFDPKKWNSKDRLEYRFSYLIDKWLVEKEEMQKADELAPSYVSKLKQYVKLYYEPFFKHTDVRDIFSTKDFYSAIPKLSKSKLSLKYKKNIMDALRHFFRCLKEERLITEVPVFKKIKVPEHQPKPISKDMQSKILAFIPKEHRQIFTFFFFQGCRPGEIRALKWDCIEDDVVTYRRSFSEDKLREVTKDKTVRCNLIFPEAMAALPKRCFSDDFVFTHGKHTKQHYSHTFLQDILKRALKQFNQKYDTAIKVCLYEATKHSFGTQFINAHPEQDKLLQNWFGHESAKMTAKYAKLKTVDAMRKVIDIQKVRLKKADRQ